MTHETLDIRNNRSSTRYNDISTIHAWLKEPEETPNGYPKNTDNFTCFSNDYKINSEYEFIAELDKTNKYSHYIITWSDSN